MLRMPPVPVKSPNPLRVPPVPVKPPNPLRVPPVPSFWGPEMEPPPRPNFPVGVFSQCMKGQRIRYQQSGEFHFLTFSSFRRRPYLSTSAAMELFENALERVRLRYLIAVAGYVVMPEHVHLLVNEPVRGLLSRTVQALRLSVSMRSRERPFWQAHYYDFNVSIAPEVR